VEHVEDNVQFIENSTYVAFVLETKHTKVNFQELPRAVGSKKLTLQVLKGNHNEKG
jgi:hypothetical protein